MINEGTTQFCAKRSCCCFCTTKACLHGLDGNKGLPSLCAKNRGCCGVLPDYLEYQFSIDLLPYIALALMPCSVVLSCHFICSSVVFSFHCFCNHSVLLTPSILTQLQHGQLQYRTEESLFGILVSKKYSSRYQTELICNYSPLTVLTIFW